MNPIIMIIGYISLLLVSTFVLIKSTNYTVISAQKLFNHSRAPKFGLAIFFLALSTSFPELMVAITSSLNGNSDFALANIIGSNIANISLILGGAALVSGKLRASDIFIKKEVLYAFLMGTLPSLLLLDQSLSRLEGLGLCLLYFVYIKGVLKQKHPPLPQVEEKPSLVSIVKNLHHPHRTKKILLFTAGLVVMILAAEALVRVAHSLAIYANIPLFLIGLILVSVGTSLPELAFGITAIKRHEANMAFGNILGSIIANSTLILGIAAIINPITLDGDLVSYLISVIAFIMVFGLFWRFVWTKHRLDRWEGGVLVIVYILFAIFQYYLGSQ